MPNPQTAVTVIDQEVESGVVEWNLDAFPEDRYNRLIPVATLQIPTDLLRPVVQIVKLDPDPERGGDVYTSKDMPEGHAAPTRVGLRKFATAAGISFVDERRVDDGRDPDAIEVTCVAEMLLPTGQRIRATGTKRIDLNAQVWRSDAHRGKFKSFFQEHVASRAQNRAILALLSLRGSYPIGVYQRPFAVVSFAPNMAHPEVRERILAAMVPAVGALYGPTGAPQLAPGAPINVTPAPEEDPAPATPTVLPGEKLAAAAQTSAEPDWMQAAMQPTAAAVADTEPDFAAVIRDTAFASGMKGAMTEPQRARLVGLLGGLNGTGVVPAALTVLWGAEAAKTLTAAQAQALANQADSVGAETFVEQLRGLAERARAAA